MIVTRKIPIADRVFKIPDLQRIAAILDRQVSNAPDRMTSTSYEVTFEESMAVEGTAAEVFNEETLTRPSRPFAVEMRLRSGVPEHYVRVNLFAGGLPDRNSAWVSGEGADWVNSTCSAIREAIEKTAPQSFWWRKHPTLLLNLIALGTGSIVNFIAEIGADASFRLWPGATTFQSYLNSSPILRAYGDLVAVVGVWWLGLFWGWLWTLPLASSIRRWIFSMWPSVEFNFGSPHLRPDNRREKFNMVLALMIIPLAVSALYDVLKAAFK
jgi:hypothetical protein